MQNLTRSFLCFPALAVVGFALSLQQRDGVSIGPVAPSSEFDVFCDQDKGMHCPCLDDENIPQQMIYDARALEAFENVSKATFFKRHGFVILNLSGAFDTSMKPITDILFPYSKTRILHDIHGGIRGPNPGELKYGWGNHQDCSLNASGFQHYYEHKYPKKECGAECGFEGQDVQSDVDFVYLLNLWGPVGMKEPLMHSNLAVEDPNTADMREIREISFSPVGDPLNPQTLRSSWEVESDCQAGNRWYYYPNMLNSEIMVFTHFLHLRGDDFFKPYMRSNLHGAFDNPHGGVTAEPRRSGERRVTVLGTNYDRSTEGQRLSL